jgi:hypothetical protein
VQRGLEAATTDVFVGAGLALPEGTPWRAPANGGKCLLKEQDITVSQCRMRPKPLLAIE